MIKITSADGKSFKIYSKPTWEHMLEALRTVVQEDAKIEFIPKEKGEKV